MRQQSLSTSSEWLACRYFMEHQTAREKALLCALWQTSTLGVCSSNDPGPDIRTKQAASRSALLRCSLCLRGELVIRVRVATGENAADRTEGELAHVGIRQLALGIKEVGARQTLRA